jgi:hypothetical protein
MTSTNQKRLSDELRNELGELYVNHKGMVLKAAQRIIKRREYAEEFFKTFS